MPVMSPLATVASLTPVRRDRDRRVRWPVSWEALAFFASTDCGPGSDEPRGRPCAARYASTLWRRHLAPYSRGHRLPRNGEEVSPFLLRRTTMSQAINVATVPTAPCMLVGGRKRRPGLRRRVSALVRSWSDSVGRHCRSIRRASAVARHPMAMGQLPRQRAALLAAPRRQPCKAASLWGWTVQAEGASS
ncbi:hypothetical protein FHS03_004818 [Massilia violacea]|uniref:Uncharacterized protein n=1 Tax=Pseudoduganella violacea TaxID=1715466 RepID=A0A7W5BEJ5_9BURK|nr:hypothetical protein [Pseudoduganella violacea]